MAPGSFTDLIPREVLRPVDDWRNIQAHIDAQMYGTTSALIFLILDHGDTICQEFKLIWGTPLSLTKLIYLLARYFGLFVQASNLAASILLTTESNTGNRTCSYWHTALYGAGVLFYMLSSFSLSMRIVHLQGQTLRVKYFLIGLHIFQLGFVCSCGYLLLGMGGVYSPNCDIENMPPFLMIFSATGSVFEFKYLFWGYLLCKKSMLKRDGSPWYTNVLNLFGHGVWTCASRSVFVVVMSTIAYSRQYAQPHLVYSWPITLHVMITCRMILHHLDPSTDAEIVKHHKPSVSRPRLAVHWQTPSGTSPISQGARNRLHELCTRVGSPRGGSTVSTRSRRITSPTGSDAIQVVPRSIASVTSSCSVDDESCSNSVNSTIESGVFITSVSTGNGIEISSEHTNSGINSDDERSMWRGVYGDNDSVV